MKLGVSLWGEDLPSESRGCALAATGNKSLVIESSMIFFTSLLLTKHFRIALMTIHLGFPSQYALLRSIF